MAYRMVWLNFPGGTPETFAMYPKYKMIRLAPVFLTVKKVFKPLTEELSVLETMYDILNYLRKHYMKKAVIAIAILLKLEYIPWEYFMNINPFEIHRAWSLGLLSIAEFLVSFDLNMFLESVGHESSGLVTALANDRKTLALYMIDIVRSTNKAIISAQPLYFDKIIRTCIKMRNWDALHHVYSDHPGADYIIYLKELAKAGLPEGFHILKKVARKHPKLLAHIAVIYGNLNILQKLNELGILVQASGRNEFGETAVHVAVALDKFDCFVYLVEKLKEQGMDCLNISDFEGNLPIHLAAHFKNTETLREIIRRNPRYKCLNPFRDTVSPLHIAVACAHLESANNLLTAFPELINHQNSSGETVIHVAIGNASEEMLDFLITCAPAPTIKARNIKGNTALHVAAKNGQIKKVATLLATKCFTGLERNCEGMTPVGLLVQKQPNMPVDQFLDLFKMSREVFNEAINCKRLSCFNAISILFNKS